MKKHDTLEELFVELLHKYENAETTCIGKFSGNIEEEENQLQEEIEHFKAEFERLRDEKQVPKKPILKSGQSMVHINRGDKPHEMRMNQWQEWCCPVCGWFVGERYNCHRNDGSVHPHDQRKSDYCNECGQHIDWSKE